MKPKRNILRLFVLGLVMLWAICLLTPVPVEALKPERWVVILYDEKGDHWLIEHNKSFMGRFSADGPLLVCLQTKIFNTPENEIYESRTWINTNDYSYRVEWAMRWKDGKVVDEGTGTAEYKAPLPEGSNASNFHKRAVSYIKLNRQ